MDFLQLESTPNPESNKVLLTYLLTDRAESRDAIASKNVGMINPRNHLLNAIGLPLDALVRRPKTEHEHDLSMMDLDPSQRPG